jgi:hypothetical protein
VFYSLWMFVQFMNTVLSIGCAVYVIRVLRKFKKRNAVRLVRFTIFIFVSAFVILGYIALSIYFLVAFIETSAAFFAVGELDFSYSRFVCFDACFMFVLCLFYVCFFAYLYYIFLLHCLFGLHSLFTFIVYIHCLHSLFTFIVYTHCFHSFFIRFYIRFTFVLSVLLVLFAILFT